MLFRSEAFDADALCHALQIFDGREEWNRRHAIFSDSATAIDRVASDRLGPEQRLTVTDIEACARLMSHGNSVAIRWTPPTGVEGNEMADLYAKGAAKSRVYAAGGANLRETSFAHTTRMTTGARTSSTSSWIINLVRHCCRYRPPKGRKLRQELRD